MSQAFGPSRIAAVLGFTPEELMLNRAGAASERQRGMLRSKQRAGLVGLAFVAAVAIAFGLVATLFVAPAVGSADAPVAAIVWGIVGAVLLVVLLSALRAMRRLGRMTSGRVREAVGPARTRARRMPANAADPGGPSYGGGMRYELSVGKTLFFVGSQAVLDAFDDGGSYRAYYTSGGGRLYNVLLSAERIG